MWRREAIADEIREEMNAHLDMRAEEFERQGLPPREARRAASLAFGNLALLQDRGYDVRGAGLPERIVQDVRHAARVLLKQPAFSSLAVMTLALGIGATTAIFSVVYGVLLKPLPFYEADRLVALNHLAPGFGMGGSVNQGAATYFTYRDNGRVFEDIGLSTVGRVSLIRNGAPEQVQALRVTDGLLSLLRVRPELGRLIQKEDDLPDAPFRALVTYGCWQRTFAGATDVIGRSFVIDGRPYEIIGVLPASFQFLDTDPEIVMPLRLNRATAAPGGFGLRGVARLKPNVTLAQANDDIARMIPLIVEQFPLSGGMTREMWDDIGLAPDVRPLSDIVIGNMGRPLWILLGSVSFVLVMAWANVANLLLVRAEGRQHEFAVRGALGASGGRIAAALLSETLMLGLAGAALGVLFAQAGVVLLRRIAPVALPRVGEIGIDGVVLLVTLATAVTTSLLFGLVPVLRFREPNVEILKETGRSTDTPRRHRTRSALAVAQVAFALVLLIVSGLMARTFVAMRQVQPGFVRSAEVQTFGIALPAALIRDEQEVVRTYEAIATQLQQVPSVTAVGLSTSIAMDGVVGGAPIFVEDRPVSGTAPMRKVKVIGPGYFETMGNPVVAGRSLTWTEIHQQASIAIVSENFAREYWGEPANAVGKRIGGVPGEWFEIVGVVGNERSNGLNQPPPPTVYLPLGGQFVNRNMSFVVRSSRVGASGFLRELQQAVSSINRIVPLGNVRTLDELMARSMAQTSFAMVMLTIAAGVALLLAVVGLYGVVSYIAAERTHEIGIRMALGAQRSDVLGLFIRHGLVLTLTGVVLGIGVAVLVTPVMSALLYGVGPTDPMTYAGVSIGLAGVTLLATYLPARRASGVEPVIALRLQR
jgi:putative ABC transport system permease protein